MKRLITLPKVLDQKHNLRILNCHVQMFFLWRSSHLSHLCGRTVGYRHSANSSVEFPDHQTTPTTASEVYASVVNEWPPACLHKLLSKGHQRSSWKNPRIKDIFQLNQYLSYKPHSRLETAWIFFKIYFVSIKSYFDVSKKKCCWYWSPTAKQTWIIPK